MEPILNRAEALEIRMGYEPSWLGQALEVYNRTEMKRPNRDQVHLAFSNSQVVATVWKNDRLIAVGRAISDFKMYSGIYDLAVDPEFQKIGIGRKLMTKLLEPLQGTCVFLTSTFGNEEFYQRLGFRFHKSALALYPERMQTTPYLYKNYSISSGLVEKNEIRFSLATKSDWKGSYLLNESLGYVTTVTGFHKRFEILLAHPDHEVVVAKKKSEIVGWVHLNVRHVLEAENFAQLAGLV
ncbi:MAG: GNAT family N-acetyltransferase, partial [Pseudobdellovibrionaceae bacterium]